MSSTAQVFSDPSGRRWKYLRRIFDVVALLAIVLLMAFVYGGLCDIKLPRLLLPVEHRACHAITAIAETAKQSAAFIETAYRTTNPPPLQVSVKQNAGDGSAKLVSESPGALPPQMPARAGKGIRAAFYVAWDAASYESLRESVHQLDIIFPEWLHVLQTDGNVHALFDGLTAEEGSITVDDKVRPLLLQEHVQTKIVPEVNNFDEVKQKWIAEVGGFFGDVGARARFRQQVTKFVIDGHYAGLMIDFENIRDSAIPGYRDLINEVAQDLHARGLRLYVSAPADDTDYPYEYVAAHSDGMVLMNYDQHSPESAPGALAGQKWFSQNLQRALTVVPREKLICGIASYGYDWSFQEQITNGEPHLKPLPVHTISVQDAWQDAQDSGASIDFDSQQLNPHLALIDEPSERHEIWYTDAATALNQMRTSQRLGVDNFALWRLGSEDRSLWTIWDHPENANAPSRLRSVPPGHEVDYKGSGEVLTITGAPAYGERTLTIDPQDGLVIGEEFERLPRSYEASQHGVSYDDEIAITFDDGPDPDWTPKILDVLKAEHVPATFFLVGSVASRHPWLMKRIVREGHEIGNHTWSHPDISKISSQQLRMELNLTEKLFTAQLGVKPLLFRPPYSIDVEPEVEDQVRPIEVAQGMGYLTVSNKIDPKDWVNTPKRSAEEIVDSVLDQLDRGNVILLHDGGGDRRETVRALPEIIHELRSEGYNFVPISQLLGKSRAEIMPAVSNRERWSELLIRFGFGIYAALHFGMVLIFVVGTGLIIVRLLFLACLATFSRCRPRRTHAAANVKPTVAVLIPAYNEEKVIVRTVRSVLNSDYPDLRVIVIDDGSTDRTFETVREAFVHESRVTVLSTLKGGKAQALNYGLEHVKEPIFVGIDADTCIAPGAIARLVPHFSDPNVAAVAGNTRVANQVNLWTRWQALEYITSQNFERRALDVFGVVTVVPGAIGAWRTSAVRSAGCYQTDTVAEDADLTMELLRLGYRVHYEDCALAYTEVPNDARGLMRQRFRWSFGILQSVWKHRAVFKRKGPLAWVALPNILVFQFLLPLVSPVIDLMFVLAVVSYFASRHSQFQGQSSSPLVLVGAFMVFMLTDFVASAFAFGLERRGTDRWKDLSLLGYVALQRFAYRQLFALVIMKTLNRAAQGCAFEWGKLERTAALQCHIAKECKIAEEIVVLQHYHETDSAKVA